MTELTTVPAIKSYLAIAGQPPVGDDGLLQILCDAANDGMTTAIERNILSQAYTEVRDGTGTSTIVLANWPVTAVSTITLLGPAIAPGVLPPPTQLVPTVDFTFTPTAVKLYFSRFPKGVQNVSIPYTAGYATVPQDLAHVATKWAALRYKEMRRLGEKSATSGGQTVSFDTAELSGDMSAIIERYRRRVPLAFSPTGLV